MKSPFNWVGNKYRFIDNVNSLVSGKSFDMVVDLMMGSGNVLFNIDVNSRVFVGNDKQELLPRLFGKLKTENYYNLQDVKSVVNSWRNFSDKESYYEFRDYWNKKYLQKDYDRFFVLETVLLLKMCSNSMVRFNPKEGYFNQGFRGLGSKKEFFKEDTLKSIVEQINKLIEHLNGRNYKFTFNSIQDYKDKENNRLLIIDPPYILRSDMYDNDFTTEIDRWILSLLSSTENKFIYFNYLKRGYQTNTSLEKFIEKESSKIKTIKINSTSMAGQQRSENLIDVEEVIVTNV